MNLIPELRFPEFEGEWQKKKLGDVLTITSAARVHKDEWTENGVPFFRSSDVVSNFRGAMNTKAYIPLELYESLSNKIGRVKKDDLLVTGGGSIGIPFLIKNNDPLYFKDADLLWLKTTNEISGYFLYSFLITQSFRKYLKSISHIGTIAHYTVIQAKNTPCHFPSPPEQQKIATFLTAVDQRIQLLQDKKARLEAYKKGVMQKLFSQELRFKDDKGQDFPDWEEKKLREVCTCLDHKRKPLNQTERSKMKGNIPYWGANNIMDYVNDYLFDETIVLLAEDGGYFDEFKTRPIAQISYGKCWVNNHTHVLKANKNEITNKFLYYSLVHKNITGYVNGGTRAKLNKSEMLTIKINLPRLFEQQKIATFLSFIDQAIEKVATQVEGTQAFKKGLLQRMFV